MQATSDYPVNYRLNLSEPEHVYTVDGEVKPGYSEIIKYLGLNPYYPPDDFYPAFGRAGHEATSLYDAGTLNTATLDERLVPVLDCYRDFLDTTGFRVRANEKALYSKKGFCTKIDRAGILNHRFGILEIKIGTSVDWTAEHQVSAHQVAWEDNFLNEPIEFKYVLHIQRLDKEITPSTRWKWGLITKWTYTPKSTWTSVLEWYKLKLKRGTP